MMSTGGFVISRKWGFIEIKTLKNWMKAARVARRDDQLEPGFHLETWANGNVDGGSSAVRSVRYSVEDGVRSCV